ncbi:HAD-like domain-containing protein [Mycena albidolilacea]|uniref:HAD-like domain-containing protein n=1 Tax=Mycena albidolilacea TaxID=1033008 RepID=A0AAD6ZJV3_9AGAR|nr:HAD-like domain-containing protein [Mycena albidolilacea]
MEATTASQKHTKGAVVFDLMGTCTDWKSSIVASLQQQPPTGVDIPSLAAAWRSGFFTEILSRFERGEPQEDIDITHRRVLDTLLKEAGISLNVWGDGVRQNLVDSWHHQTAKAKTILGWPDSVPGIELLKQDYFVVVLANGTTRLQMDIVKSTGLPFHSLFSSQLLQLTKPDPQMYLRAVELLNLNPSDCIMVAAHAYDLRAAAKIGMKTVYIQRNTEDLTEDMDQIRTEFDAFVDGTTGDLNGGIPAVAALLKQGI